MALATLGPLTVRRVALATVLAIAIGSLGVALAVYRKFVLLILLGLVFSELFQAIADPLWRRFGGPRGLWLTLAVVIVLAAFGGIVALALYPLAGQTTELLASLPRLIRSLAERGERIGRLFDHGARGEPAAPALDRLLAERLGDLALGGGTIAMAALTAVFETLALVFLGAFVAATPRDHKAAFIHLLPETLRPRGKAFVEAARIGLRNWMVAVGAEMAIMTGVATLGLWLIGVPYFLVFGTLAGLFELVPYLGPALAFLGPLGVCLATDPTKVVPVAIFYFIVHGLDANVIAPLVVRSRAHVPPSLVVLSILVLGQLAGIVGFILATPALIVVIAAAKEFWLDPHTTETESAPAPARELASP